MAAQSSGEGFLVESEFLFALRKSDKHHGEATKILELCKKGVVRLLVLSSAVMEVKAVMYSQGFKGRLVEEVCSLVDAQLVEAGVSEYVPTTLADAVLAEVLKNQHPSLTFFDALHVATARNLNMPLLSNDKDQRSAWTKTITFRKFLENLF
jgi:predicted nucleic acid-binding protein